MNKNNLIFNDYEIYLIVAKNIKKYRKAKKITTAELASRINFSHGFIRQLESEKCKQTFSLVVLYRISLALEINISKFFEDI